MADSTIESWSGKPLITLDHGSVNVGTLHISMSKKHTAIMCFDIACIMLCSFIVGFLFKTILSTPSIALWICICSFVACVAASLCKTGIDFRNWVYTMNVMQLTVGDRYMADVMSICNSLIESGGKLPDSEKGEGSETKEDEKTNQEGI